MLRVMVGAKTGQALPGRQASRQHAAAAVGCTPCLAARLTAAAARHAAVRPHTASPPNSPPAALAFLWSQSGCLTRGTGLGTRCMAAGIVMIFWIALPSRSLQAGGRAQAGRQDGAGAWSSWEQVGARWAGYAAAMPCRQQAWQAMHGSTEAVQRQYRGRYSLVVLPVDDVAHIGHLVRRHCRKRGRREMAHVSTGVRKWLGGGWAAVKLLGKVGKKKP